MSQFLNYISGTDRAIYLKEKVRLYEQQKTLGELEGQAQLLRTKRQKYEKAGEGLMKSAISVMPRDGSCSGASLADRAAWAEKALNLRDISVNNSKEAAQELLVIEPLKNQAEHKMRVTTERLEGREREMKVSYRGQIRVSDESAAQDIGETIMFYSNNISARDFLK